MNRCIGVGFVLACTAITAVSWGWKEPAKPNWAQVLPFEGPGSVAVLDDGTLVITMKGENKPAAPLDTLILRHGDADELALVDAEDTISVRKRSTIGGHQKSTSFLKAESLSEKPIREALVSLSGTLSLSLNVTKTGSELTLAIKDTTAENQRSFLHEVSVIPIEALPEEVGTQAQASSCSASCAYGAGSITCSGGVGCYAYCDNGFPKVGCGTSIKVVQP